MYCACKRHLERPDRKGGMLGVFLCVFGGHLSYLATWMGCGSSAIFGFSIHSGRGNTGLPRTGDGTNVASFHYMAFSKNVRLSPTPPPFRVGRCTLPTSFSKKQPFRGNNVASPNSIFCATLKQGARGRAEAGYQRCRKMWDRGVAKGV